MERKGVVKRCSRRLCTLDGGARDNLSWRCRQRMHWREALAMVALFAEIQLSHGALLLVMPAAAYMHKQTAVEAYMH